MTFDKHNTRRKVVNSPLTFSTGNNSFTQKQTLIPFANSMRLTPAMTLSMKQPIRDKKEENRGYLIASEIDDIEGKLDGAQMEAFSQEHLLGKGAYASTYFGVHKESSLGVAMKIYTYSEKNLLKSSIDSEIAILKKLNHPNIVKLFHYCEKPGKAVLFLE